jgi:5-dehydro-4-deoxyglucarate dehydratase
VIRRARVEDSIFFDHRGSQCDDGVPSYSSAVQCFAPTIADAFHAALRAKDYAPTDALLRGFSMPLAALPEATPEPEQLLPLENIIVGGLALLAGLTR